MAASSLKVSGGGLIRASETFNLPRFNLSKDVVAGVARHGRDVHREQVSDVQPRRSCVSFARRYVHGPQGGPVLRGCPVVAANVTEALATLTINSRSADIHTNSEAPQRATSIVLASEKMRVPEDTDGLSNPRRSHDRTDAKKDARGGSGALRGPWQ